MKTRSNNSVTVTHERYTNVLNDFFLNTESGIFFLKYQTVSSFKKPFLDFTVRNKSVFKTLLNIYDGDFNENTKAATRGVL